MRILITGDYVPQNRVSSLIEDGQYEEVFGDFRELSKHSDYAIVNIECPVVIGDALPIEKSGPNLRCTKKAVEALKFAGFNCVTLANNHFYDYGGDGVNDTISTLKEYGIDYVGGGENLHEASNILYKRICGKTFALINCCEHEFSIASETRGGCNPLNPIQQYYSIKEAKKHADYIMVIVHGGHEHFQLPSPRMIETYRFFVDAGADAVVNHHQHCFSGYEIYKGKPIFYGLGNFCFDNEMNRSKLWVEGYAVTLSFNNERVDYKIHPYIQSDNTPSIELLPSDAFDERLKDLNSIINNPKVLTKQVDDFYSKFARTNQWLFEPLRSRILFELNGMGLLPSLITKKHKLVAANLILCESLRDRLNWWLEH